MSNAETVYTKSKTGRRGVKFRHQVLSKKDLSKFIPEKLLRKEEKIKLPELTELDVMRYFINLSRKNFSVDTVFILSAPAQ